jgi:hypothetical protein
MKPPSPTVTVCVAVALEVEVADGVVVDEDPCTRDNIPKHEQRKAMRRSILVALLMIFKRKRS